MLYRFTCIMDKVKKKLKIYSRFHTCTKSSLIVGNILVPSILSVEAIMYEYPEVRTFIFWFVWVLSILIALVSSFVTFCNTQKKFNLYNQFNTKLQREMWAYLTLTGSYTITKRHKKLIQSGQMSNDEAPEFVFHDDSSNDESPEFVFHDDSSNGRPAAEETKVVSDDNLEDLFPINEVVNVYSGGHMLYFQFFMNRIESLYRLLSNSNIDIDLEDMSSQTNNQQEINDQFSDE